MLKSFDKNKRILWSFVVSVAFSIIGLILIFNGFLYGRYNAINSSRPSAANGWIISEETIKAYTYIPIFIGVLLLIFAIIIFTISYYFFMKNNSDN